MQNSLGVIKRVRTIVISSMTVIIDNAVNYKFLTLGSAAHIIVTDQMTVRIRNAAKYKYNTFRGAVQ